MTSITALIPCYNGERFIADAVRSVLGQDRQVDEILVVDDRSTDDSAEVARRAGAKVIALPENVGPSRARNIGLEAARNPLVAFLDADDVWEPTHCSVTAGLLDTASEAVLAFGRCAVMQIPAIRTADALPAGTPSYAVDRLLRENFVPQSATVVRRDVVLAAGGYDAKMRHSEDYDLWLRMALLGPFICSHQVTAWWRMHPGQASRDALAMVRGTWEARKRALAAVRQAGDAQQLRSAWQATNAAWCHELDEAWGCESPMRLDAALAMRREVGLPAGPYWKSMLRRHALWHPRRLARTVWRRARGVDLPNPSLIS